ncbi:hypothetical protein NIES593_22870 [Hydrococcus rivularis NIES-593]|uniref:Type II secretion system protein GspE N-terminal domain-containing protein n=1 Tax=Hydrococcus rivularis NIES-593 TaxID=1921803 RepID=A0A1U7H722_9CYAN|nr:hypothetical protein [Hydrococcus rivularis]OKH17722.1 hypothetical protein NIES593_22870 [Hydrococcus rivularis NIES-593]
MSETRLIVSDPCIIVPQFSSSKPLGNILQEADLVSASQIELALQDQTCYRDLRIGEILALRGWLKQETADFFVEQWPALLQQKRQMPLGYYLRAAGLLDEQQLRLLLSEQGRIGLRLGALAVLKGWLKPTTLEFFLKYLCPDRQSESPFTQSYPEDCIYGESSSVSSDRDTLTEDTLTEEMSEKEALLEDILETPTIIEDPLIEELFDEDEISNEDTPTQIIIPCSAIPSSSDRAL